MNEADTAPTLGHLGVSLCFSLSYQIPASGSTPAAMYSVCVSVCVLWWVIHNTKFTV